MTDLRVSETGPAPGVGLMALNLVAGCPAGRRALDELGWVTPASLGRAAAESEPCLTTPRSRVHPLSLRSLELSSRHGRATELGGEWLLGCQSRDGRQREGAVAAPAPPRRPHLPHPHPARAVFGPRPAPHCRVPGHGGGLERRSRLGRRGASTRVRKRRRVRAASGTRAS